MKKLYILSIISAASLVSSAAFATGDCGSDGSMEFVPCAVDGMEVHIDMDSTAMGATLNDDGNVYVGTTGVGSIGVEAPDISLNMEMAAGAYDYGQGEAGAAYSGEADGLVTRSHDVFNDEGYSREDLYVGTKMDSMIQAATLHENGETGTWNAGTSWVGLSSDGNAYAGAGLDFAIEDVGEGASGSVFQGDANTLISREVWFSPGD